MLTQQEVIKKFMKSLDETTQTDATKAVDEAFRDASEGTNVQFTSMQEVINAFLKDCNESENEDDFLKKYCGIILENKDTGAITGQDTGGTQCKDVNNIVPENTTLVKVDELYKAANIPSTKLLNKEILLDSSDTTLKIVPSSDINVALNGLYKNLQFTTKNGLTVTVENYGEIFESANSPVESETKTLAQKKLIIINGLYSWWIENAIKLNEESYGTNFGFGNESSAIVKSINVKFINDANNKNNAEVNAGFSNITSFDLAQMTLTINFARLHNVSSDNINGGDFGKFSESGKYDRGEYLDSSIAHEFTHAVMAANVNWLLYRYLPTILNEGLAELTKGADFNRNGSIIDSISDYKNNNDTRLVKSLTYSSNYDSDGTVQRYQYSSGYMLLRYFAKQCADISITSNEENDFVVGSDKGDTLTATGNNTFIYGYGGNDKITVTGDRSNVDAGTGLDTISVYGSDVYIQGGGTIDYLPVQDTFNIGKNARNIVIADYEECDILNFELNGLSTEIDEYGSTVFVDSDGTVIVTLLEYTDAIVNARYGGKDTQSDGEKDVERVPAPIFPSDDNPADNDNNGTETSIHVINGTSGNDEISNYRKNAIINGGLGNDSIENYYDNVTIDGGDGDDTVQTEGNNNLINGGDGNDDIYNSWSSNVTISGGGGHDYISNYHGENVIISSDTGDDHIYNTGSNVTINSGDGDDSIDNHSRNVMISGDNGHDYIYNNNHGGNVTISGGTGNDSIYNIGFNVTISGGAGDDSIVNDLSKNVTISGGGGNDEIQLLTTTENTIIYTSGDGNDCIQGFTSGDTLIISGDSYSTTQSSDDIIVTVGEGKITLLGAATLSAVNIESIFVDKNTTSFNTLLEKKDGVTYDYTGGDKKIENYSPNEKVKLSSDFAGIDVSGNNFVIKSSSGALTLENVRDQVINVTDSEGNTAAYVYMASGGGDIDGSSFDTFEVIVGSETESNNIKAGNGGSSLIGGGGDNTLQGGNGQDSFKYSAGTNVITNYQSGEILNFAATYTGWTTDGNDLVINAAEGSVRISEATDKLVSLADANGNLLAYVYKSGEYEGVIDGRGFGTYEVIVGSDNVANQIFADTAGSSLWGGRGSSNDDLYGNIGTDEYVYAYGNGQDNIYQAGSEDTVNLLNVSLDQISGATIFDNGVNLQFTDGGSLHISGQVGNFKLEGQVYHADYQNKTWY